MEDFKLEAEWHFYASSHGKNALRDFKERSRKSDLSITK